MTFPSIVSVVLDTTDARALAEFYRELFGLEYREGYEPPPAGEPDPRGADWLLLRGAGVNLAFQQVAQLPRSTWPEDGVPQMLHLDATVPDLAELERQRARAEELGAQVLLDASDDADEPIYVFADPAGHPF